MEKKKISIDIEQTLKAFFTLNDWKQRALTFIGVYYLVIILMFLSVFIAIIPFIGWLLSLLIMLALFVFSIFISIYLIGYMLEISEAVSEDRSIEEVKLNVFTESRIKNGLKFFVVNFVYNIPYLLLFFIGYGMMVIPMILDMRNSVSHMNSGADYSYNSDPKLILFMMLGYLPMMLAFFYELIYAVFVYPALYAKFVSKKNISGMFDLKEIWEFIKKNISNILLYCAVLLITMILFYLGYFVMFILMITIIGILLIPAIFIFWGVYIMHTQAYMLGIIIKGDKENKK